MLRLQQNCRFPLETLQVYSASTDRLIELLENSLKYSTKIQLHRVQDGDFSSLFVLQQLEREEKRRLAIMKKGKPTFVVVFSALLLKTRNETGKAIFRFNIPWLTITEERSQMNTHFNVNNQHKNLLKHLLSQA